MSGRIELRDVSVERRGLRREAKRVLEALSLEIAPGEHLTLAGANGAGKTSLLLALVGAVEWSGRIEIAGVELSRRTTKQARKRVGFVFAEPADQLLTETAYDEVAFGPRHDEVAEAEVATRVRAALEAVGLSRLHREHPEDLSLGEQRRLALAAALARDVEVILCDEPTASLDPVARRAVIAALSATPKTLVVATHDLAAATEFSSRLALLAAGRVVHVGPVAQIVHDHGLLSRAGLA